MIWHSGVKSARSLFCCLFNKCFTSAETRATSFVLPCSQKLMQFIGMSSCRIKDNDFRWGFFMPETKPSPWLNFLLLACEIRSCWSFLTEYYVYMWWSSINSGSIWFSCLNCASYWPWCLLDIFDLTSNPVQEPGFHARYPGLRWPRFSWSDAPFHRVVLNEPLLSLLALKVCHESHFQPVHLMSYHKK